VTSAAPGTEPILAVPGILSPIKITVKGAPEGASAALQPRTLDCDLARLTVAPIDRMGVKGRCGP